MDTCLPPSPQWNQPHSACLHYVSEHEGWLLYTLNNSIYIINPFSLKFHTLLKCPDYSRINCISSRPPQDLTQQSQQQQQQQEQQQQQIEVLSTEPSSPYPSAATQELVATDLDWNTSSKTSEISATNKTTSKSSTVPQKQELVVSASEDGTVHCWDISTESIVASLIDVHKSAVKAVDWTRDGMHIISGDKQGTMSKWDPFTNTAKVRILPGFGRQNIISCIATRKNSPDIAVGNANEYYFSMESGDILIVVIEKAIEVRHRLHGHSAKIQSLDWQPGSRTEQPLLASGSADQTVRVWDVAKEFATNIGQVPEADHSLAPNMKAKIWAPVAWTSQGDGILTANRMRIITWDIHDGAGLAKIECLGGSIVSLDIGHLNPGSIAMGCANEAIKIWDTTSQGEPYACQTIDRLQSKVRAIKWHPTDEHKIAFGLENGRIGFVENLSQSAGGGAVGSGSNWRQKKLTKKGGKAKLEQRQVFFQSYHSKEVKSIIWCSSRALEAPVPELFDLSLKSTSFCLISVGKEGKILVSNSDNPTNGSLDLELVLQRQNQTWYQTQKNIRGIDTPSRKCIAIHPNEDLVAIGNGDGSIEVFELKYFRLVHVYQGHSRPVEVLKWNWGSDDSAGHSIATSSYILASASDIGQVAILQLAQFSRSALAETQHQHYNQQSRNILPTTDCLVMFHPHTKEISDIAWSPHSDESNVLKLATSSYDGHTLVHELPMNETPSVAPNNDNNSTQEQQTDVTTSRTSEPMQSKTIACFSKNGPYSLSVLWSLTNTDRLYTGGSDWMLWDWSWKSHRSSGVRQNTTKGTATPKHKQAEKLRQGAKPDTQTPMARQTTSSDSAQETNDNSVAKLLEEVEAMKKKILSGSSLAAEVIDSCQVETPKRPIDTGSSPASLAIPPSKRAKSVTPSQEDQQYQQSSAPPQAELQSNALFPMSAAAFKLTSKRTAHLEIIRLVRNIFCRRYRHGLFMDATEMEATRQRWRAMLEFLEKDGESDGAFLFNALAKDLDELNLTPSTNFAEDDNAMEVDPTVAENTAEEFEKAAEKEGESSTLTEQEMPLSLDVNDSKGDLVFYGSREAVIALAEMEAQAIQVQNLNSSSQSRNANNFFVPGSGFGVFPSPPPPPASRSLGGAQQNRNNDRAALGQIPVAYWLGDVPKMSDILTSLPASELGVQDWIGIALSPMGGVEAWKEMMVKTADKFLQRREIHGAVLCLLGVGKVYEAVEAYRSCGMFREALMLLRIRSMEGDEDEEADVLNVDEQRHLENEVVELEAREPQHESTTVDIVKRPADMSELHIQILTEWGQKLERRGFYEQACKCQLTLASLLQRKANQRKRKPQIDNKISAGSLTGLSTLARRMDVPTLRTTAAIAILLDDGSKNDRIAAYEMAVARKREADEMRRAAAIKRQERQVE
ncbi:Gem-associated protein 5 [Podila humilis]|nr:Gem-associated protein 5 [Podila humilis]